MCARCRSCHRFTRPGVIPTSTPHMDRLLGPQGIGQAGSDSRQQVIEELMRQIMHYDAEFRREELTSAVGSNAMH